MNYTLRPAWRSQWGMVILAAVLFLIPLLPLLESLQPGTPANAISILTLVISGLPFIVVCLIMIYRHYAWRFTIDDVNIESHRGIIAREVNSIRIVDVRNLNVKQSILQRLLGIGDVEFSSAAGADAEVVFREIANPMRVKQKVQALL